MASNQQSSAAHSATPDAGLRAPSLLGREWRGGTDERRLQGAHCWRSFVWSAAPGDRWRAPLAGPAVQQRFDAPGAGVDQTVK